MSTQTLNSYGLAGGVAPRAANGNVFQRLTGVFGTWMAERRRYRETLTELSYLSDRELADIGVAREEIEHVARGLATRA